MGVLWFPARTATCRKLNIYLLLTEKADRRSHDSWVEQQDNTLELLAMGVING